MQGVLSCASFLFQTDTSCVNRSGRIQSLNFHPGYPPPLGAASTNARRSVVEYLTHRPIRRYLGPRFCFLHERSVSTLIARYDAANRSLRKPVTVGWV